VMPVLDEMVTEGLVTTEPVHIVAYRGSEPTSRGSRAARAGSRCARRLPPRAIRVRRRCRARERSRAAVPRERRGSPRRGRCRGARCSRRRRSTLERLERVQPTCPRGSRRARASSRSAARSPGGAPSRPARCAGRRRARGRGSGCAESAAGSRAAGSPFLLTHRELVPPGAQGEAEPEVCGRHGVRARARDEGRRRRDADHDRVERLVEPCALELDRAQECLRVGGRGRAAEDGRGGELARDALDHAASDRPGSAASARRSFERARRSRMSSSYG
jgi:hypothetical protein